MKSLILIRPIKTLLNYKIITISLVLAAFIIIGVPYYIKRSIEKYAQLHELEVAIDNMHFNWRVWKIPSITINKVDIKNKALRPTFTRMQVKSIVVEPKYIDFFKSYFKDYNFFLEVKAIKVLLINGSALETDTLASNLTYRNNVYKIYNFNLHPLRIKLDNKHTSRVENKNEKTHEGRLIIYVVKGEGQYHSLERELEINLKVPPAATQMPDGAVYSVQAKGKIKFVGLMPYQNAKDPDDPGLRGKITYTIDNFSNLLHQLNQAAFISNIAKNLGTIIGYPIPRVDPFAPQTEIFTNAVSLDMTFKPDGTYLGPMKL